jgi:hypothetical protein
MNAESAEAARKTLSCACTPVCPQTMTMERLEATGTVLVTLSHGAHIHVLDVLDQARSARFLEGAPS